MNVVQFEPRIWVKKAVGSLSLLCALLLALTSAASASAFQAVVSSSGSFSAGTVQLEGTTAGSVNCYSTGSGAGGSVTASNTQPCSNGSPIPTGQLTSGVSSTATTTLSSVGSVNATSATVASSSCGVAELADSASATDWSGTGPNTALAFGGLTYQAAGPLSSKAITLDGSTGWAESTVEYTNPEAFTVLAWFKTTSAQGAVMGFSNSQDPVASSPSSYDRALWIDPAGKLDWGIYNGTTDELTSPSVVDTGSWVFAAASVGSAGTALYVNGTKVAFATGVTSSQSYSGWWSAGYAYLTLWPDIPASYYFAGSLAQLAVVPSQLTAAQVTALNGDSTLSTYTAGVNALSPASYWPLNDSGAVPYEGSVPGAGASATLVDASGNANAGTAEGGVSLAATGPAALGTSAAVTLNGSTGYVETASSYANPQVFSLVAWFKTTSLSGGTVMGFSNVQGNGAAINYDRILWLDNSGKLVFGIYNGTEAEVTSTSSYNNGAWHMVVAELSASGEQLWVDGTLVATNASGTPAQSYSGYWHLGWDYFTAYWPDEPTNSYLAGALSEAAVVSSQLTASQISSLYNAGSAAAFALVMGQLAPASYWPLQDSASNICGTTEVTLQETLGASNTCIYPPEPVGTACPALSSGYLLTGLGSRSSSIVATSGSPVTVTIKMKLSATSASGVARLHMLPGLAFGTQYSSTPWSAGISYPNASVEL